MNDLPRNFLCEITGERCVEKDCKRGFRCVEAEGTRPIVYDPPLPCRGHHIGHPPEIGEWRGKALLWHALIISAGSRVRMKYGGTWHYAEIAYGGIFDGDRKYSPAAWACKIANGTSRNAWRDLEFYAPGSARWEPAQELRERYREQVRASATRGKTYVWTLVITPAQHHTANGAAPPP